MNDNGIFRALCKSLKRRKWCQELVRSRRLNPKWWIITVWRFGAEEGGNTDWQLRKIQSEVRTVSYNNWSGEKRCWQGMQIAECFYMENLTRAAASWRQKTFSDKNKRRARHRRGSCGGGGGGSRPYGFEYLSITLPGTCGAGTASKTRRFSAERKRARRENLILVFRHPSVSVWMQFARQRPPFLSADQTPTRPLIGTPSLENQQKHPFTLSQSHIQILDQGRLSPIF